MMSTQYRISCPRPHDLIGLAWALGRLDIAIVKRGTEWVQIASRPDDYFVKRYGGKVREVQVDG